MKEFIDSDYQYETDELGRPGRVSGVLSFEDSERDIKAQRECGGTDRLTTDDGGHLIGARFGGSSDAENLVPMDRHVNRSVYKSLENEWADALDEGKQVAVDIQPYYSDEGERPSAIMAEYSIDDGSGESAPEYFSVTNMDLRPDEFDIASYELPDNWDGFDHTSGIEGEFAKELEETE